MDIPRKILVTGASGLLGANFLAELPSHFEAVGVTGHTPIKSANKNIKIIQSDLLVPGNAANLIAEHQPEIVVHCAAYASVDGCESDPKLAEALNVLVTAELAKAAAKASAYFVFISTDQVFDGEKGNYSETDQRQAINCYGETKIRAEDEVLKANAQSLIIRTNFFGFNLLPKLDLAAWILGELEQGKKVPLFTDIIFSPILVNELVRLIFLAIDKRLTGVLHLAGHDPLSKYEFGKQLAEVFEHDQALCQPVLAETAGLKAKRPKNMSLNVSKAKAQLSQSLPTVVESIAHYKKLFDQDYGVILKKHFLN